MYLFDHQWLMRFSGMTIYKGKHVSGCGWVNGTEKTDLNRLKRTLNRLDEPLDDFSKTAFNTLLTAFLILTKNPVPFPVNT